MPWGAAVRARVDRRADLLSVRAVPWLKSLRDRPVQWSGPSLYFHRAVLQEARRVPSLRRRCSSLRYSEQLYACLGAWGLHRLDNPRARLVDFAEFRTEVRRVGTALAPLSRHRLERLSKADFQAANDLLGKEIDRIRIVVARWPLVANSKLLHHLLPGLVPPIDRNYTLQFFLGRQDDSGNDPSYTFARIFEAFWLAAVQNRGALGRLAKNGLGRPTSMGTTVPKLLDDALLVGKKRIR